jgi:small-conductance mechanosensitive channel
MEKLFEFIQNATGISKLLQLKIFLSLSIIVLVFLLRWIILRIVWKKIEDIKSRYYWRKSLTYITFILLLFLLGNVWISGLRGLGTFFGLLTAGVAIALKDLISNIAGWMFIIIRRPFTLGDRIQIADRAGDVIDLRLFQFTMLEIGNWVAADQSTGRIIHIPNGKVFTEPLANYSKAFKYIWNEIPVLITFESNWQKAKEILLTIVKRHAEHLSKTAEQKVRDVSKKFMILYSNLTPTVYTSVKDSGVLLTLRYLCDPRQRRGTEQGIWEDVLHAFSEHPDMDFAYPTQRFYDHYREGQQE